MQLTIRKAEPDDYLSIHALICNELGYAQTDYDKLCSRLEIMGSDSKYTTTVAESDGRVVGFIGLCRCIVYNVDGEYMQITALAVLEELQNKGVGSQLLRWAEDYALSVGVKNVVLTSRFHRTAAHAFYEGNGYEKKSYAFKKDL